MSVAVIMVGIFLGLVTTYVVTSIVMLKKPFLLHKKKRNTVWVKHISHRGGAGERIENTMPAFRRAMEVSTEMLELDCHLLSDGEVIVSHDFELSRLTNVKAEISQFSMNTLPPLNEILQLTFAPDKYTSSSQMDERKFTRLEDVFAAFPKVPINIDIKIDDDTLIRKVNEMICKYNREHITIWGNRNDKICKKCYNINPNIGMLFSQKRIVETLMLFYIGLLPFFPIQESYFEIPMFKVLLEPEFKVHGFSWYSRCLLWVLDKLLMRPSLFKHLQDRGIATYVWVCNKEKHFKEAFDLGATGIMTDFPTLLRAFIDNNPSYATVEREEMEPIVSQGGDDAAVKNK